MVSDAYPKCISHESIYSSYQFFFHFLFFYIIHFAKQKILIKEIKFIVKKKGTKKYL